MARSVMQVTGLSLLMCMSCLSFSDMTVSNRLLSPSCIARCMWDQATCVARVLHVYACVIFSSMFESLN